MLESVTCGSSGQEVSEGNNISNWARSHPCGTVTKNVNAFCPCPINVFEAELKF